MSDLKLSEVLDLAADEIQRRGWTKGEDADVDPWGLDGKSPVCLEGAIFAAAGLTMQYSWEGISSVLETCPAYQAVYEYLDFPTRSQGQRVTGPARLWEWNDAPARTAEEVIEVLRAAAAVERTKEESLENSEVRA